MTNNELLLTIVCAGEIAGTSWGGELFTQDGTDPTFQSLLDDKTISVGSNTTRGVTGSTIKVNTTAVAQGESPIPHSISIHTL